MVSKLLDAFEGHWVWWKEHIGVGFRLLHQLLLLEMEHLAFFLNIFHQLCRTKVFSYTSVLLADLWGISTLLPVNATFYFLQGVERQLCQSITVINGRHLEFIQFMRWLCFTFFLSITLSLFLTILVLIRPMFIMTILIVPWFLNRAILVFLWAIVLI